MTTPPTYLGDGVYATSPGYGTIELRLGSHTSEPVVYLNPAILAELIRWSVLHGLFDPTSI